MGEKQTKPFQLSFNGLLKVDFQGSHVTSDGGLILVRELDERLGLGELIDEHLSDSRQGTNKQFTLADLLRQSVYSRLAGYEDLNDAERVSIDPMFRLIGSQKIWDRGAALTSTLHGFETEMLASEENLLGLMALNRELVGQAEAFDDSERVVLDMDSTESPVHGQQEGSAYNGHFESVCYHPLLLFNGHGDCLAAKLRPGNVHSAEDWDELLLPEIERQQAAGKQVALRGDGAFAKPEVYEASEERGVQYAIRIPANKSLELEVEDIFVSAAGKALPEALGALQEFSLSGGELVAGEADRRQGRASPGRAVPAGRIHRDEHELAKPLGGALLQQARHGGAVDQGRQTGHALYAANAYVDLLKQHKITISMSRKANPYDNAKAESFMKTLKYEEVYRSEYRDLAEARASIGRFLEQVYNEKRLHSALGYCPPTEFEQKLERRSQPIRRPWREEFSEAWGNLSIR